MSENKRLALENHLNKKTILIVVGPTAVGKTEYAIALAKALNGEIVSADSMQLYKFMDIGSAKPTEAERQEAAHHLVDEIDPREPFSVFEYQNRAKDAINRIFQRDKLPIISGGTGLYVNALIYDMDFSAQPKDHGFREKLQREAAELGNQAIHDRLRAADPKAADRIHPNNLKKMIRALEMLAEGQDSVREFHESFVKTKDYDYKIIGLTRDRGELYERIDRRVDLLMEAGLLQEIEVLCKMGLSEADISMKGIGYKELIAYLNGAYGLEEAVELVKKNSRHYAKRQLTWFRRYEDIRWFDLSVYKTKERAVDDMIRFFLFDEGNCKNGG